MGSSQTTTTVTQDDQEQLRDLIQMNIDSRDGYAYAGKRLADKHSDLSLQFFGIRDNEKNSKNCFRKWARWANAIPSSEAPSLPRFTDRGWN